MNHHRTAVHGHRGARGYRPENTLSGARHAIQLGCDAVEVDLRICGDGNVILHHDAAVSRRLAKHATLGREFEPLHLARATLDLLAPFDVGTADPDSDVARRFPDQLAVPGARIPTLDEFLDDMVRHSPAATIVNLELKSEGAPAGPWIERYVTAVMDCVTRHGLAERTFIQSFDWRLANAVRKKFPAVLTGLLTDQQSGGDPCVPLAGNPVSWTGGLDLADFGHSVPQMIHQAGGQVWSSNFLDLTRERVREAHALGMPVYAWTVNEVDDLRRVIDLGVDAITTDYPDRLVSLLGR